MDRTIRTHGPYRWFDSSPAVIRLVVRMYVKYPLSLRNVEDRLAERGIDICHETGRLGWHRFGPMLAAETRRTRDQKMRACPHWRWHRDEVNVTRRAARCPTSDAPSKHVSRSSSAVRG
jgi:putative transposase